jgi:hypothetical protein
MAKLADQSQRLFFQMVKPDSPTLTRDCAFVVDLVFDKTEHISELGHQEMSFNYYSTPVKRLPLPDMLA